MENLIELEPEELVSDQQSQRRQEADGCGSSTGNRPPSASGAQHPSASVGHERWSSGKKRTHKRNARPSRAYQRGIAHRNRGQHARRLESSRLPCKILGGRAALMLGQCYRDLCRSSPKAVEAFKEGLYMPSVADADLEMNYQLAQCL